jgi:hypothetical protein
MILLASAAVTAVLAVVFLGGIAVGVTNGHESRERRTTVRRLALDAERRLHDLTRETFIRMSEAAERRSSDRR